LGYMKEINAFILSKDLDKVTKILNMHNIGDIAFYEITGMDFTKHMEVPDEVRSYSYGRTITPDFQKRTKVETFVPDSLADQTIQELVSTLGPDSESCISVFIKEISNVSEIEARPSGESLLAFI
jgi:nitrogen regulatory protein P-II 1